VIDTAFIAIVAGSFAAAVANAMFSAGGALIVLAITSTVLPIQAIVPIHSTLLIGSTATRVMFFWSYIDWKIVWPFIFGSLLGALVGARIYIELPEALIATAISGALLHSVILHTSLERRQVIGTMAGALTGMGVFKIAGYTYYGFDYMPYLAMIAAAITMSLVGTAVGKRLGEGLSEEKFRLAYRILVTLTALRLMYVGLLRGIS
jgi:uncharacterized membrane protein YfcA